MPVHCIFVQRWFLLRLEVLATAGFFCFRWCCNPYHFYECGVSQENTTSISKIYWFQNNICLHKLKIIILKWFLEEYYRLTMVDVWVDDVKLWSAAKWACLLNAKPMVGWFCTILGAKNWQNQYRHDQIKIKIQFCRRKIFMSSMSELVESKCAIYLRTSFYSFFWNGSK